MYPVNRELDRPYQSSISDHQWNSCAVTLVWLGYLLKCDFQFHATVIHQKVKRQETLRNDVGVGIQVPEPQETVTSFRFRRLPHGLKESKCYSLTSDRNKKKFLPEIKISSSVPSLHRSEQRSQSPR